ncbi:MAG: peptide-methionine (S)-S-oxide reductase MsrA [bacterium]|nr:peptide-methionine (S)-S-oxide reductase MsrA [bacterium]
MKNSVTDGVAIFGGGCFWCTEAVFKMLRGVHSVIPGYAGGSTERPTYEDVCRGGTGHAEVIQVEFNTSVIAYNDLLAVFFATHDPTTPNRQGGDTGPQYRSIILYTTISQKEAAEAFIMDLNASHPQGDRIVTEVKALDRFWLAENYHHDYYAKNPRQPYCELVINPKLDKAKKRFEKLLSNK